MTMRIVDAGPLLFLARLNRLDILKIGASRVLVPSAVLIEIQRKNDPATEIIHASYGNWLGECLITDQEILKMLPDLGKGEREVIAQAIEQKINSVVLDDLDARRIARRFGLIPTGTVGLLLAAKKKGLLPSLKEELERLKEMGFWISESLWKEALKESGE
jgi:hypothetical protein